MALNPSFRRPNTIPSGAAHAAVISAIHSHDQSITDLNQAIVSLKSQLGTSSTSSSSSSGTSTTTQVSTENVTNVTTTISGGKVNNQSGVTSYTTAQTDNGALIILADSSAVALTLNNGLTTPFYCFVVNQGTSNVTLTPQQNTIDGLASQTLLPGYFLTLFFDGAFWWSGTIPIVPLGYADIANQFLTSYNAATGLFSSAQPSFSNISGIAAVSQGGTGTATPSLISGTNISVTGSFPNQTISTSGYTGTITTAKITTGGTNGSMTFSSGILVSQTAAT